MSEAGKYAPVTQGLSGGFRLTLILIGVYAALGLSAEIARQMWLTQELRIMQLPIFRLGWAGLLPFFLLWQGGWALVIGMLTGGLIGELWVNVGRRVGGRVFALLVLILCAGVVVALHAIFQISVDLSVPPLDPVRNEWPGNSLGLLVSYPGRIGLPSLVYIITGTWASRIFGRAYPPAAAEPAHVGFGSGTVGKPS